MDQVYVKLAYEAVVKVDLLLIGDYEQTIYSKYEYSVMLDFL